MAWKYRAAFLCVIANREHVIEAPVTKLIDAFRSMAGQVDSDFLHNGDGFRPDAGGLCAGAFYVEAVAGIVPEQPFSHLASGRIAGTEYQNALLIHAFTRSRFEMLGCAALHDCAADWTTFLGLAGARGRRYAEGPRL